MAAMDFLCDPSYIQLFVLQTGNSDHKNEGNNSNILVSFMYFYFSYSQNHNLVDKKNVTAHYVL